MHKKLFLISSFIFAVTILISPCLFAAYEDENVGLYKFDSKIMATWISYDNGSTWTEIFSYSAADAPTIDIAAGEAGPQMGTFMSGATIPVGTITHVKARIPFAVVIKGWVKSSTNNHYYVTDNTIPTIQTRDFGTSKPSESDCTEITLSPPEGYGDYQDQPTEISGGMVATEDGTINISIRFPLGTAITVSEHGGEYVIHPSDGFQPTISQI